MRSHSHHHLQIGLTQGEITAEQKMHINVEEMRKKSWKHRNRNLYYIYIDDLLNMNDFFLMNFFFRCKLL
jgi:hypothetical protein